MKKLVIYEGNINDTKFVKIDKLNGLEELQELIPTENWTEIVMLLQRMYKNGEIGRFALDSYAEVRVQAIGSSIFYKFVMEY